MTEFKKGDRVRVTFEGTVLDLSSISGRLGVRLEGDNHPNWVNPKYAEKLADPEPKWVNGDVIHAGVSGVDPLYRHQGEWYWSNGGGGISQIVTDRYVSERWREGRLKILCKADSPKQASDLDAGRGSRTA